MEQNKTLELLRDGAKRATNKLKNAKRIANHRMAMMAMLWTSGKLSDEEYYNSAESWTMTTHELFDWFIKNRHSLGRDSFANLSDDTVLEHLQAGVTFDELASMDDVVLAEEEYSLREEAE